MGAKKKGAGGKKGGKGKKEKKPRDAVGEAVNEVEEAERKVSTTAVCSTHFYIIVRTTFVVLGV